MLHSHYIRSDSIILQSADVIIFRDADGRGTEGYERIGKMEV